MTTFLRSGLWPLVALCAGLVGLGMLEYRWTEELARAEQDRLRAGMEAASVRFGDDLSREMGRLLRAFRPVPRVGADDEERFVRWGYDSVPQSRTVDVHVGALRQKLERVPAHPELIVTVHRQGYRFTG